MIRAKLRKDITLSSRPLHLKSGSWKSCVACLFLMAALLSGCANDDPAEPPGPSEELTHQEPPNGNNLILEETVGSSADLTASIWEIADKSTGGYYFRGYHRSRWVVGALDGNGQIDWSRRTYYSTAGIGVTPDDISGLAGLIFVVGNRDVDNDSWSDTGVFTIFDGDGTLVDELTWDDPDISLRFDDMIFDGVDSGALRFLAVGRKFGNDGVYHPLVATLTLSADSTLHAGDQHEYAGVNNIHFWEVMNNPDPTNDGYVLTGGLYKPDRDLDHSIVFLADANYDIQWQQNIITDPGLVTRLHLGSQNAATADTFYCMGYTEVDRTSSNGSHWKGGLLASFSTQGQVHWIRTYDASVWADYFRDCQLIDGVLYAAGNKAAYQHEGQIFGYGWLAKINPQTGDILSSITLGDERWYSRFNCLHVVGQHAWAAGYTQWKQENGTYNYWCVNVDIGGMTLSPPNKLISSTPVRAAIPSDPPPGTIAGSHATEEIDGFLD